MEDNKKVPALIMKVKALYSSLSKSEERVADYIIAHPEEVIYLSVAGLAENSGVSDATVVRTCQKIGMSSYQDLKVTLAQDIVTPIQSIHEEIEENDSTEVIIEKIFQSTLHTLRFTYDTLKAETLKMAAEVISNSNRVNIYGLGNSHSIALDLQHKLMRLGINAYAYTDSHIQCIASTYLKKNDTVFAISHSGSSKDVVSAAEIAKKNGATVISLTNIGRSPLYNIADIQLCTASNETRYRILALSSRAAQMTIIDVIYTLIAFDKKSVTVEGFRKIEKEMQAKKY
ncbi:MAG: MurR/RpiR family transcriptional regulator [Clostridia bacterium]